MNPEYILLRFGELNLKGKNRSKFENIILQKIYQILQAYPNTNITKAFGRVYVELKGEPYEPIAAQLLKVFGLGSFSPVTSTKLELDAMRQAALGMMRNLDPIPSTFKVNARRPNKGYEYDSHQLNHLIGGYVLENIPEMKVDVHNPEVELRVEVREKAAYIFSEIISGLGGFPTGSNGKAMLLLSGGIDSPVAGWLAMKKGVEIEAVHFHSFPYTSERAKYKVMDLTRQLADYTAVIKLHMVSFTEIQTKLQLELKQHGQESLMITLMRRAMLRITEKLANRQQANAIVTGESLGQVASQTISSLNVIGRAAELPILQPLITMDKGEIIYIAEKIGTFPISILPYEDCCTLFLPKFPSTNPNLRIVEQIENKMMWLTDSIEKAVSETETSTISADDNDDDLLS